MTETDSQPIAENEQVKELLALLKDNNAPGYEEFAKLIEHVTGMEQRLLEATEELKAVRQEMQGLQNHSLKDALQKSCKAMETNISVMRHRLSELKGQIINECRNCLTGYLLPAVMEKRSVSLVNMSTSQIPNRSIRILSVSS